MKNKLKFISLLSYSMIVPSGHLLGNNLPWWLILTSFDLGNSDQIFAICGLMGFILSFNENSELRIVRILYFILLIMPIIKLLIDTPFEKFNVSTFQTPLLIFVVTYVILIIKSKTKKMNSIQDQI